MDHSEKSTTAQALPAEVPVIPPPLEQFQFPSCAGSARAIIGKPPHVIPSKFSSRSAIRLATSHCRTSCVWRRKTRSSRPTPAPPRSLPR